MVEGFGIFGQLPVLHQLVPVQLAPGEDELLISGIGILSFCSFIYTFIISPFGKESQPCDRLLWVVTPEERTPCILVVIFRNALYSMQKNV